MQDSPITDINDTYILSLVALPGASHAGKEGHRALPVNLSSRMHTQEPKDAFPDLPPDERSLWTEQAIKDCQNILGNKYAIRTESFQGRTYFSVYYTGNLIVDGLAGLSDTHGILEAAKRYEDLKARLEAKGVTLLSIRREPWKTDRTKYRFAIEYKGSAGTLFSHVNYSERLPRNLPDCFPANELRLVINTVNRNLKQD